MAVVACLARPVVGHTTSIPLRRAPGRGLGSRLGPRVRLVGVVSAECHGSMRPAEAERDAIPRQEREEDLHEEQPEVREGRGHGPGTIGPGRRTGQEASQ